MSEVRCESKSLSCRHGPTDVVTDQTTALSRGRKPWRAYSVRLVCLFCLLGLLVTPLVYAFSPVLLFSLPAKSHCVYIVYDPFGKELALSHFGLPSEHFEQRHDVAQDSKTVESDTTTPLPEMLTPQKSVATRDELRRHIRNCLRQFPNQPYVYVVQKVVRRQFVYHEDVVQAMALKVENPTFDRRRLKNFRIGGCS